ncbi:hypothetical protein BT69DRAFT_1347362 [Atractiella rhizophila]|nr:hypothetical protein BT69DRAFT_1347362 [Atractiella rhizophila]
MEFPPEPQTAKAPGFIKIFGKIISAEPRAKTWRPNTSSRGMTPSSDLFGMNEWSQYLNSAGNPAVSHRPSQPASVAPQTQPRTLPNSTFIPSRRGSEPTMKATEVEDEDDDNQSYTPWNSSGQPEWSTARTRDPSAPYAAFLAQKAPEPSSQKKAYHQTPRQSPYPYNGGQRSSTELSGEDENEEPLLSDPPKRKPGTSDRRQSPPRTSHIPLPSQSDVRSKPYHRAFRPNSSRQDDQSRGGVEDAENEHDPPPFGDPPTRPYPNYYAGMPSAQTSYNFGSSQTPAPAYDSKADDTDYADVDEEEDIIRDPPRPPRNGYMHNTHRGLASMSSISENMARAAPITPYYPTSSTVLGGRVPPSRFSRTFSNGNRKTPPSFSYKKGKEDSEPNFERDTSSSEDEEEMKKRREKEGNFSVSAEDLEQARQEALNGYHSPISVTSSPKDVRRPDSGRKQVPTTLKPPVSRKDPKDSSPEDSEDLDIQTASTKASRPLPNKRPTVGSSSISRPLTSSPIASSSHATISEHQRTTPIKSILKQPAPTSNIKLSPSLHHSLSSTSLGRHSSGSNGPSLLTPSPSRLIITLDPNSEWSELHPYIPIGDPKSTQRGYTWRGAHWLTSHQQWLVSRFPPDEPIIEKIRLCEDMDQATYLADGAADLVGYTGWEVYAEKHLKYTSEAKLLGDIYLQQLLLDTGTKELVVQCKDSWIGSGEDGTGLNKAGKVMEEMRKVLRKKAGYDD